jgi:hypothetical protein
MHFNKKYKIKLIAGVWITVTACNDNK